MRGFRQSILYVRMRKAEGRGVTKSVRKGREEERSGLSVHLLRTHEEGGAGVA